MANIGTIEAEVRADTVKLNSDKNKTKNIFNSIDKSAKGMATKVNASFKKISIGFGVATAGGVAMLGVMNKLRNASTTQQKAIDGVNQVLKSSGRYTEENSKKMQELATELQKVSNYGDEFMLSKATRTILTFSNISIDSVGRVQQAVADMSAGFGQDLKSSAIQLGKALDDPVTNLGALSRIGVSFTIQQKETIKMLAQTNRMHEAQAIILEALEKQVGGQAKSQIDAAVQMKNAWGDVGEELGSKVAPIFDSSFAKMTRLAENLQGKIKDIDFNKVFPSELQDKIKNIAIGIAGIGISIVAVGSAIAILSNPITWLIGGAGLVYKAWSENLLGLKDIFNGLYEWINRAYKGILKLIAKTKQYQVGSNISMSEKIIPVAENLYKKGKKGGAVSESYFNEQIGMSGLPVEEMERMRKWMKSYSSGGQIMGENLAKISSELKDSAEKNIKAMNGEMAARDDYIAKIKDKDIGEDLADGTKKIVAKAKDGLEFTVDGLFDLLSDIGVKFKEGFDKADLGNLFNFDKYKKEQIVEGETTDFWADSRKYETSRLIPMPVGFNQAGITGGVGTAVKNDEKKVKKAKKDFNEYYDDIQTAGNLIGELGEKTKSAFLQISGGVINGLNRMQQAASNFSKGSGFFGKLIPGLNLVLGAVDIYRSITADTGDATDELGDNIAAVGEESAKANKSLKEFSSELFNVSDSINMDILRARTLSAFNNRNTVDGSINVTIANEQGRVYSNTRHAVNSTTGTRVAI